MPRVNLVPQEEQAKVFRRQFYIIPIAAAVLIVGAMAGSYFYYSREISNTQSDLDATKQSNAALAKDVAELQKYDDLKNQKQQRQNAVTADYALRYRWSRTLDDLMFVLPTEAWLINLKGTVPGAPTLTSGGTSGGTATGGGGSQAVQKDLTLEGYTYEMPTIATMMIRIGLIPSLADVTLIKAEKEMLGNTMVVHFWVGASLNQGASAIAPAAPVTGQTGPTTTPTTGTGTQTTGTGTGTTSRTSTTSGSGAPSGITAPAPAP